MAERDELGGFLGAHDSSEDGGVKNRAFFILELTVVHLADEFFTKANEAARRSGAGGGFFSRDIDHAGLVRVIEVSEVAHVGWWEGLHKQNGTLSWMSKRRIERVGLWGLLWDSFF